MNRNVAKAIDFDRAQIAEYLYGKDPGTSDYLKGRDFSPGALSVSSPVQLHETERHEGGNGYVHLSNGCPAIKNAVLEALDGIPIGWVRNTLDLVRRYNPREYAALDAWIHRASDEVAARMAERIGCVRSTYFEWRDSGRDFAYDHLHHLVDECLKDRNKQS